jgi:hypothetical protein
MSLSHRCPRRSRLGAEERARASTSRRRPSDASGRRRRPSSRRAENGSVLRSARWVRPTASASAWSSGQRLSESAASLRGRGLSWSPDGRELAYAHGGLVIRDTATGRESLASAIEGDASWSPDGTRVLLSRPPADLLIITPSTRRVTRLDYTSFVYSAAWHSRPDVITLAERSGGLPGPRPQSPPRLLRRPESEAIGGSRCPAHVGGESDGALGRHHGRISLTCRSRAQVRRRAPVFGNVTRRR